jgi:hypothetical protein
MVILVFELFLRLFVFLMRKKTCVHYYLSSFFLSNSFILVSILLFWFFPGLKGLFKVYNDHQTMYWNLCENLNEKSLTWPFNTLFKFISPYKW